MLDAVPVHTRIVTEEAFGLGTVLSSFTDFSAALVEVNASRFGLQAGIFTRDLFKMLDAWDQLDVDGVLVNDVPSYRVFNMPYGEVKESGLAVKECVSRWKARLKSTAW